MTSLQDIRTFKFLPCSVTYLHFMYFLLVAHAFNSADGLI